MRVLVTGASGFIGSHVVRNLVANGHEVTAVARPDSSLARIADIEQRVDLVRWIPAPESPAVFPEGLSADVCIHLAWYAVPGSYLTAPENIDSMVYSLRLLEALHAIACRHVVMIGTCAEYDTDVGYLREVGPTRPATLYAAAKLATALIGAQRASQLDIGFTWARIFYLYGPQEDPRRMLPSLIRAQLAGSEFEATAGDQVKDYLHVDDVASAICALALKQVAGTYNVCSGEPITVRQFMTMAAEIAGRPELIRFGAVRQRGWEPPFVCGDNQRLRATTGWAPRHALADGLADTIAWWKQVLQPQVS